MDNLEVGRFFVKIFKIFGILAVKLEPLCLEFHFGDILNCEY